MTYCSSIEDNCKHKLPEQLQSRQMPTPRVVLGSTLYSALLAAAPNLHVKLSCSSLRLEPRSNANRSSTTVSGGTPFGRPLHLMSSNTTLPFQPLSCISNNCADAYTWNLGSSICIVFNNLALIHVRYTEIQLQDLRMRPACFPIFADWTNKSPNLYELVLFVLLWPFAVLWTVTCSKCRGR